jgi:hypothetical protein
MADWKKKALFYFGNYWCAYCTNMSKYFVIGSDERNFAFSKTNIKSKT